MVFESIVADLLNRFLGDYVENLDRSQLKLGIWGGDVALKHLDVKESALDELDLPVKVVSGHLGQLILQIPWKNIYSAPVIATIEGLLVVVVPNLSVKYNAEKEEKAAQDAKLKELQRIEEAKLKEAAKDKPEEKKDTFTEKLVTNVIKNLQVKIKNIHVRYEDSFTDPAHPFAAGFTLHNLSFQTTDENWKACIIQDAVQMIHKTVNLDSLAVYWNSKAKMFSKMSPEERKEAMMHNIATSTFKPSEVSYMLGPIVSTAHLRINSRPELDGTNFKTPKIWLDLNMKEIAVGLSKHQYQDLMRLLESFDRMAVATLYRKYRPDVPHKGHAKEWWKFCLNAVLEEDIRRNRRNWSWNHMKNHRNLCRTYKEFYSSKLLGKKITAETQTALNNCENTLDLFNITVVRKQAEIEVAYLSKKKKETEASRGWFSGWFGRGGGQQVDEGTTGNKIMKQFEQAMTAEEKAKLYDAIGYQEQPVSLEYPVEFVENQLFFTLHDLTVTLSDDTRSNPKVLIMNLKGVSTTVEQRPSGQAIKVDAKIDSFIVIGTPSETNHIPYIVSSQKDKDISTGASLLNVLFETNPLDKSCDQRLKVQAQPLEIVYDALTVNQLAQIFKPPEPVSLHQLQAAAMMRLEDFREMSAFGLQYAIEQHKYFILNVDLKPSYIIIPENGSNGSDSHLLIVSLGNFKMNTLLREPNQPTVKSLVKAGSTETEVLSTMIAHAYDKFQIEIQNIEILLTPPGSDWKKERGKFDVGLHLLHPTGVTVQLHKCIITDDPRMPKLKISGELPLLNLNITEYNLIELLNLALSIPLPESEPPQVIDPYRTASGAVAAETAQVNAKAMIQIKKAAVQSAKEEEEDDTKVKAASESSVQYTDVDLKFELKEFGFDLYRKSGSNPNDQLLRFAFQKIGTCVTVRTNDMSVNVYLGSIMLQCMEFTSLSGEPLYMINTPSTSDLENLFTLKYLSADKKGPDFESVYNSIAQLITASFAQLEVILHQDAILSILQFSNDFVEKMNDIQAKHKSSESVVAIQSTDKISIKESKSEVKDAIEKKTDAKEKIVPKKKKTESIVIDVKLEACLQAIGVIICSAHSKITDIRIKGLEAGVTVQKSKTSVTASLKDLVVSDPAGEKFYSKILSTVAGGVLDVGLVLYSETSEDEYYANMAAVDISVNVVLGRMKIVFLNKFVSGILGFLNHFQAAKDKMVEAGAVAAEAAKHGMEEAYEKATKMSLDVCIQAPVIIVPQHSTSDIALVLDLGIMKLQNKIEIGNKKNELGMPAIFDNITLELQNLQLSRANVQPSSTDIIAECPLLEPVSFNLGVIRNLTSNWYHEVPEIDISGKLEAVKMIVSQDDYATVMKVLTENLAETAPTGDSETIIVPVTLEPMKEKKEGPDSSTEVTEQGEIQPPVTVEEILPDKIHSKLNFAFQMDSFSISLYNGGQKLTVGQFKRDLDKSLACVELKTIGISAVMMSNNSLKAEVILIDCILDDTRTSRVKGITRLMKRTSEGERNMIDVTFTQDARGDKYLNVKIFSFTLVVYLNYLMTLADFFVKAMPTDTSTTQTAKASKSAQTLPTESATTAKTTEAAPTSNTIIDLKLEQPDIILIEEIENLNSSAVFLNCAASVKIQVIPDSQNISGLIRNLQIFTACFNSEYRADTKTKILSPCEISLNFHGDDNGQHVDIRITDIILHVSPGTVQLLTNILGSLSTQETVKDDEKTPVIADYSTIWNPHSLKGCNYWFLQNEGKAEAEEITEDMLLEVTSTSDDKPAIVEQLLLSMNKIILTIEAGVGRRTVPMILLETSFEAEMRNWSSLLNIGCRLSMEMAYYNEKIAVWEPLIEPVEAGGKHQPWGLVVEIVKNIDADVPDEENQEELVLQPPVISITVVSQDVMELTMSKVAMEVLTNLGQAFGEAVKQTTVSKSDHPLHPYCLDNKLGIPLTLLLENGRFQITEEDASGYTSILLEPGAPPLHLTEVKPEKKKLKPQTSVLKKQDIKDDVHFNIKVETENMNLVRKISVTRTDKRYYQLPYRTYPGDQWGFVVDIKSLYGCKNVVFHSILQVHNHFSIPVDVYYMMAGENLVEWCGSVESQKSVHIPIYALYTPTSELFFKPKDLNNSYSLSLKPFLWKELLDNPSLNSILQCKYKDGKGQPFFINVAGEVERIHFEETNKKTIISSFYKLHLHPTVVLRNLLPVPLNYSLQGVNKKFTLNEGESNELWTAELGKTGIEVKLSGYLDRDWICYKTLTQHVDDLSVWTLESSVLDKKFTLELGVHTQNLNGSLVLQIYAPFWMVNKTNLQLTYRSDENNIINHPAYVSTPVLFSFKAKAFFAKKKASLKIADSDWSDKFSLDVVGSSGTVATKTKDGKTYGVGVQIKLSQSGLTKIVIFTPFYLIVNNSQDDVECTESEDSEWMKVVAGQCIPFWPKNAKKAEMIARYYGTNENTMPFSFKDQHSTLIRLNNNKGGLHIDCQVAEASIIITFNNYSDGLATVLLVNDIDNLTVTCNQSGNKELHLPPKQSVLYTWDNPLDKRILNWKCEESDGVNDLVKDGIGEFNVKQGRKIYWVSFLDGMQRVLLFTEDLVIATTAQEAGELEQIEQEITVSLQGVGVSLVNNTTNSEIMYIGITSTGIIWEARKENSRRYKPLSLKECLTIEQAYQKYQNELKVGKKPKQRQALEGKLEVDLEKLIMYKPFLRHIRRSFQTGLWCSYKTSPHQIQLHAKINRLQIDNQLLDCVFPVVLAPVPPPKSVVADSAPKPYAEASLMLRKAEHSSIAQVKYFKMLIQEFHIKVDQGFLNSLITFFSAEQTDEIDYAKQLEREKEMVGTELKELAATYSTQEQKNYFDILHFSPLKVHISFSMTGTSGKEEGKPTPIHSNFINLLLQSVGVTLTEIQDVVFRLDFFERQYVFMSQKQLVTEAAMHYTRQAIKQLYMLVLGLDVIGNPVGLLMGLGEGVTDLFYEPFQGAIQGPEEFAEGLALGVKSLFGHAVGGAAGAVSRITGTLGKGLAALTLDKEYQRKRRQNLNKRPADISQGLAQSGKGLVMGVFEGVTGIVTKPLEGAREEGVEGFFKGVGKGLIGVVTRPTAGAIDFASGSLEAVKRATELSDEIKRLRPPRFIRQDGIIRPYLRKEAEGNRLLQEVEKGKYASTDAYIAHAQVGTDEKSFLMVTSNRVMYVSKGDVFGQWNTEWQYRFDEIKEAPIITEKGIQIMLKEPQKKKLSLFGGKVCGKIVHIKDPHVSMWMIDRIVDTMKNYS